MTRRGSLFAALVLLATVSAPVGTASPADAQAAPERAPSWEKVLPGQSRSSSPVAADIDGDGVPEIVHGDQEGRLHVRSARTGNNIAHWPQQLGSAIDSPPAVGDLDGDGRNEIVVGVGSTWRRNQPGGVKILRHDGTVHCTYVSLDYGSIWDETAIPDGYPEAVVSSPALGDVDGDGRLDVVFGGFDLHVHAMDRNCRSLAGFPHMVEDSTWSSPALYDVDDDGRLEIFVGSDQTPGGAPGFDWAGGEFRSLDWRNGQVVERWKRRSRDVFHSSPAIGDINGDGRLEVVTGGGNVYGHPDGHRIWAWHLDDGSPVPGWPQATGGPISSSPALGDLDGNGRLDVVVGSRDGSVHAWRGDGSKLWTRGPIGNCCVNPPGPVNGSPIIADLDGDGDQDVAIGTGVAFHLLDGRTGQPIAGAPNFGWSYESAALVADFGSTGRRLVTVGFDWPGQRYRVAAYPLSGTTPPAWPMFQRDARRLGAPPSGGDPLPPGYCTRPSNPRANPSAASGRGYWVLGRDGGVFAHGVGFHGSLPGRGVNARAAAMSGRDDGRGYWIVDELGRVHGFGASPFLGDMRGTGLNAPIIGMAATPSGNGYWLLGRDGGIFTFGDARFYGSTGARRLNAPIISMAATPSGRGYWLLAADGGVFTFGDAKFYGSTGAMRLNAPVISMAVAPSGQGYWLLGADGGIFTFGRLGFHGSVPGTGLCHTAPAVQIRASATGRGYWIAGRDGGIFTFGDAIFRGAPPALTGGRSAVDMAAVAP